MDEFSTSSVISDEELMDAASKSGWGDYEPDDLRLMIAELLVKASAGCYNSYTEESLISHCKLLLRNRQPNKKGREYLMRMFYRHSNEKAECYELICKYRG